MKEKDKKLYMIGNAHLDPVWLWQWQEGFQEVKATFRSALDRMKEYPDFVFTSSSAAYYEWVENNDAEMFEEIRQRIKEGRWVIVGGWWIQPDCNAPNGESFVRQGLYAQRYFYEKFGIIAQTGYNVDSFGHNGMLPQILKKCGMKNYVFMRPGRHEKGLPSSVFKWESIDGSRVNAYRIPFEYCTWAEELSAHIKRCASEIKANSKSMMCFYGVGNHGGGPTKKNIESIQELNKNPGYPMLIMASPDMFFEDIEKSSAKLPVVQGELFHHASGCYSACSEVKRLNRKAENRLIAAEKFSAMANILTGQRYPLEEYRKAWKNVLFNQFHDIMAGTSIEPAYDDAREAYGASFHTAAVNMNYAVQAISWRINIPMEEGMKPIVVFNPHSFKCKAEIEMESPTIKEGYVLVDDSGIEIPMQIVQSLASAFGRCRICFIADLPALGYRTYRLVKRDKAKKFETLNCTGFTVENDFFKIEFDEDTGYIKSFVMKKEGNELFGGAAAVPTVIKDNSDTWSHGVRRFNEIAGYFKATRLRRVEHGPVKSVIRVESKYGESRIIQDFTIYKELDYITVKTTVDWHEKFSMLKIQFPMNLNYFRGSYDIPYGFTEREPDGEEYPMQSWMDFEGINPGKSNVIGLSILNDGKSSYDAENKKVGLTVLRSPIYANHEPYTLEENLDYTFMDQGIQHFTYVLYPHEGSWEDADTVRHAMILNQKPVALFETYHEGKLPQCFSFINISAPNVIMGAMKQAEDGSGDIIMRMYETAKKDTDAEILLPHINRKAKLHFTPCEIKTLRIPKDESKHIVETNMLEMNMAEDKQHDTDME